MGHTLRKEDGDTKECTTLEPSRKQEEEDREIAGEGR
jgi:hypothetical protein